MSIACALEQIGDWPVVATAGVARAGQVLGVAGPVDRRFAWASVTKLTTALATLVAVEEGTVELDEPAGPAGSTLRHLLAHASGLAADSDQVLAPPGTRRIYSNRGIELAAELVADHAGMPWGEYLHGAVLEPLAMTGYHLEGSAASGATGSLADLLRLGQELLAPTLVASATLEEATSVAFPGLIGVLPGFGRQDPNDWGLGFERRDHKHPHWTGAANSPATFGHFGQSGSFLWVDPDRQVVCASLADTPFGPWAVAAWPALADAVLAALD